MRLSNLVPVFQRFPSRAISDVTAAVRTEMAERRIGEGLPPGARIAIGVGSRGISNLAEIVRAVVAHFRAAGCEPFIIPVMGSHGGGTDQGQAGVLAQFGVTEAGIGCPVRSSVEVVELGRTADGIETYVDRLGSESDGIFLVNRIKWHTTFDAGVESGLVKMAAIGLGKLRGAADYHRHIVRRGFAPVIESVGYHVLASGKVLGGLAILEDAHHETARVLAMPAARIREEEPRLLELVKSWMPRLLFDEIDILIVDEIGKHISGVGMDSKVINRHPYGTVNPWKFAPRVFRIYVRDLSPLSHGNANGLGMADMISERMHQAINWQITRVNALTASNLASLRTPLRAANDLEALQILSASVGRSHAGEVTCVWIRNTLELSLIAATANLLESQRPADVEVAGPPVEWEFDADGNLAGGLDRVIGTLPGSHPEALTVR